ncbi:hypothetical protein JD77_03328 [Micromonospora olivasterospora]|uniref:Uncharacterized protein n=1 Tax=Micromonospora olivasterospora TaxID=1880 RepID=A0A562IBV7_MICOL|nr:hypothetical protein JD77_03328 [Micromonospora olivasterospora]
MTRRGTTLPHTLSVPGHPEGLPTAPGTHTAKPGAGQNRSLGRYVPHTRRSVPQTSPTVARARRASFIG